MSRPRSPPETSPHWGWIMLALAAYMLSSGWQPILIAAAIGVALGIFLSRGL